jgi:hypothetical protein
MANIADYLQANTNLGLVQAGSAGVQRAGITIGAQAGQGVLVGWQDARFSLLSENPAYATFFDHFLGDSLKNQWATDVSTGATIAIVGGQAGGVIAFTTDADDNDHATLGLGLNYLVSNGWIFFEARVRNVTASTARAVEIGLSDALSETAGLAFSNHSVAGVTDVADNAVIFGYDTDASMTAWAANWANAGTPGALNTGVAVDHTTWHKFAIAVNSAGDAFWYIDGVLVASRASAIATTALLTPWVSLKSLSAAAKTVQCDYAGIIGEL